MKVLSYLKISKVFWRTEIKAFKDILLIVNMGVLNNYSIELIKRVGRFVRDNPFLAIGCTVGAGFFGYSIFNYIDLSTYGKPELRLMTTAMQMMGGAGSIVLGVQIQNYIRESRFIRESNQAHAEQERYDLLYPYRVATSRLKRPYYQFPHVETPLRQKGINLPEDIQSSTAFLKLLEVERTQADGEWDDGQRRGQSKWRADLSNWRKQPLPEGTPLSQLVDVVYPWRSPETRTELFVP